MTKDERNVRRRLAYHLCKSMARVVGKEMVWGRDDCALFHADVEMAARGDDPCAAFRGRYRTQCGARRVMGHGGLPKAMRAAARKHGWRRVRPEKAKVGDLGLMPIETGGVAVVRMLHRGEWIGRNDFGWSMVPTDRVRVAWSVI